MWHRLTTFILLVVLLTLAAGTGLAAESKERPRIGLCLAGGGARGGAQIGVLKVLEEMRVPIDCIAGTSIGSIVGGLYASGMSPAQMDSAVLNIDWFDLFNDSPERKYLSFRRKEEDYLPYFDLEMGFSDQGLALPGGFVAGQKLMFLLRSLTLQATGIDDFDDLPIPFRAAATNLADGSLVVIDHGQLADAMRASMAIPGAFTPHVIDGQTLIDGGFHRNIPYDVVKSMGADIVIVVDVTPVSETLSQDPTMAGVLANTINVSILINSNESRSEIGADDIMLTPDLPGIGVGNFEKLVEASQIGQDLAEKNRALFGQLSLPEDEYQAWRSKVRAGFERKNYEIGNIEIASTSRVDPRRIRGQIKSEPGTPLDFQVLGKDLTRIYAIDEFELVDFALEPTSDPRVKDLSIRTQDKRWGPNYLNFGLSLVGHLEGQAQILFLLYHRMAAINKLGAEWRNQVFLGDRLGLDTEFYQPLTMNGRFFVAPRLTGEVDKRNRWLTYDLNEVVKSKQYQIRLDFGLNISNCGELRLGPYYGYYAGDIEYLSQNLDQRMGGWLGRFAIDRLDNVNFPRRGWVFDLAGKISRDGMGATTDYDKLYGRLAGAATAGRVTFLGRLEGGTSFQTSLPFNERFELGGFNRLTGYERGRIAGDESAVAAVGFLVRLAQLNPQLGESIFLGLMGEAGQAWDFEDSPSFDDLILGFNGYLGAQTLLGPVYVGYGMAEAGHHSFYVMLGRVI